MCVCDDGRRFANFSLLLLFYLQVITGDDWRARWRSVCLPLYLLLTMSMTTFTVVWAFNSSNDISDAYQYGDEYDQEFMQVSDVRVQLQYSAGSYLLLSALFGFFSWKMAKVRLASQASRPSSPPVTEKPMPAQVESWKQRRLLISKPRV